RNALGQIAYALAKDPDEANKIAAWEILGDDKADELDEKRAAKEELGTEGGAEITEETIGNIFSKGQQTIFSKMKDGMGESVKEQLSEKLELENLAGTAGEATGKISEGVAHFESTDTRAALAEGAKHSNLITGAFATSEALKAQKEAFTEERERLQALAEANGGSLDALLSEKISGAT
ncbi:MAG: hypothetical protein RRY40_00260, partial [Oscillospiraceae bacterium]